MPLNSKYRLHLARVTNGFPVLGKAELLVETESILSWV